MDWLDSIQIIKKAQRNNHLVIFVGSGVSNNSEIPTWWGLIKEIADEIGYNRCLFCKKDCDKNCTEQYDFTQDEYLKIPEYYYQSCKNKNEYFHFVENVLRTEKESNAIDDMIFKLLPSHIITTNYDTLLENSSELNTTLYKVIASDKDLLKKTNDHYIIKMHGDFSSVEDLVLKESDYINYEQSHILITTFIKSLLIDHTFLFIGYSLNDYNLKLIIGWIDYFVKKYDIEERPAHFLIQDQYINELETKYLQNKKIYVINTAPLPEKLINCHNTSLTNKSGIRLFSYLNCIFNEKVLQDYLPIEDVLYEKIQLLLIYSKIANKDIQILFSDFSEIIEVFDNSLVIHYDYGLFEKLKKMVNRKNDKAIAMKVMFKKANITSIVRNDNVFFDGENIINLNTDNNYSMSFKYYLENNYEDLFKQLDIEKNIDKTIFYNTLFKISDTYKFLCKKVVNKDDKYNMLVKKYQIYFYHLYNDGYADEMELKRIIKMISPGIETQIYSLERMLYQTQNKYNIEKIINELKKEFSKDDEGFGIKRIDYLTQFKTIRTIIYDYYFFCFENAIASNYSVSIMNLYSLYINSILYTYHFKRKPHNQFYLLNEIDIDIFIKYSNNNDLMKWIKEYHISELKINTEISLFSKFKALCKSYHKFDWKRKNEDVFNFLILLNVVKIETKCTFIDYYIELIENIAKSTSLFCDSLYKDGSYIIGHLKYFINQFSKDMSTIQTDKLYEILYTNLSKYGIDETNILLFEVHKLSNKVSRELKKKLSKEIIKIGDEKLFLFDYFYDCLSNYLIKKYINRYLNKIRLITVFNLIFEKKIAFNDEITRYYLNLLQEYEKDDGEYQYDFYDILNSCMLLYLNRIKFDLQKFSKYREDSDYIDFMLNPDKFNYSKIDLTDQYWCNFLRSKKYSKYLIEHKEEILTEKIKENVIYETSEESYLISHYLLDFNDFSQMKIK